VAGVTTTFTWDDESTPNLLSDGTTSYLYGPDGLPIEQTSASGTNWFVHDQIGSTVELLNAAGAIAGGYSYTPYGVPTHTGTATTPLQYTGQYTDAESGLVYLRARYYDPGTAEFLTLDPMVAQTGTPYAYTGDDPINGTDLNGMCGWACWGIEIVGNLGIGAQDVAEEWFSGGAASVAIPEEDALEEEELAGLAGEGDGITAPGPHSGKSIPARSAGRDFTSAERQAVNKIGKATGCHACGTTDPGTKSGNFILDHQPVSALNDEGLPQRLFPHCKTCSARQGGIVGQMLRKVQSACELTEEALEEDGW
jgi:RHS repeat-associated protein